MCDLTKADIFKNEAHDQLFLSCDWSQEQDDAAPANISQWAFSAADA